MVSLSPTRQRQAPCPCGSRRSLATCCLPWEEAFQHLVSRLVTFAASPRIRRREGPAAAVFWNIQRPFQPGKGQTAAENLRFLEWFLLDQPTRRGGGPLLGQFADAAVGLSQREEDLLFALLLSPVRAYEVTETLGPRGVQVKDLLSGTERALGPLGLAELPIRSDVVICRLVPLGRLTRPGVGLLRLPAAGREELLAYLRTSYRVARPARHVSLEDFLDGATHLYHHFFLLRGRDLGGRARETARHAAFAPGQAVYKGTGDSRIRAGLDRQSELVRDIETTGEVRYAWIDLDRAVTRATVLLRSGEVQVSADTRESLADARRFMEACLRGLIEPIGEEGDESPSPPASEAPRSRSGQPGGAFFARILERWPDTPLPLLDDRTPREACRTHTGRQQVAGLILGLERDFARLKRLGRAWADVTPLREQLNLPSGPDRDRVTPRRSRI
ncbi:MAG: hypothetical protein A3H39_15900 [candidate division NC10 bacterium RIFCSPLOWO2_02_FULL_66_22]|nr:MAG: hypothetical protein A3H39_15900 [candidate division NC10 bacterium RIFCSPLOWO2_02_FULL_66_22]